MKKSEMITIIENIIETELTDYPNSYPGNRTVAEIIMSYIEQAGMQPPYNLKLQRLDDTLSSIEYFEWEQEELIVTNVDVENKTVTFKTKVDNE